MILEQLPDDRIERETRSSNLKPSGSLHQLSCTALPIRHRALMTDRQAVTFIDNSLYKIIREWGYNYALSFFANVNRAVSGNKGLWRRWNDPLLFVNSARV